MGFSMLTARYTYSELKSRYHDFSMPHMVVELGGKPLSNSRADLLVNNLCVELTSGFEASVAKFRIYNAYNPRTASFCFHDLKPRLTMGTSMAIHLGYKGELELVFVGFVASVCFCHERSDFPYIEVTGMDVKGIMMAGTYVNQISTGDSGYSGAILEILRRTGYEQLRRSNAMLDAKVSDTPDAAPHRSIPPKGAEPAPPGSASAYTIEMVSESDYEFVVKAAKKFNYEFFVDRGTVLFRKAKADPRLLMELGTNRGIITFSIEYSILGIVGSVEARAVNPGDGKVISAKSTLDNTISTGNAAKGLMKQGKKVLVDPTIDSQAQAEARAASLMERMSYSLGTLEADCVGIPELLPGCFLRVSGLGAPADNTFYITAVTHEFSDVGGYHTKIVARTDQVKGEDGL